MLTEIATVIAAVLTGGGLGAIVVPRMKGRVGEIDRLREDIKKTREELAATKEVMSS